MKNIISIILIIFLLLMVQPISAKEYIEYNLEGVTSQDGYYDIDLVVRGIDSETINRFISKYPSDVVFVIDASSSMDTDYNGKTRLDWAIEKSNDILNDFQSDSNVGLVIFSSNSDEIYSLTSVEQWPDSTTVSNNLKSSSVYLESGTNIYSGLQKGVELLNSEADGRSKYLILFTDGKNTGNNDPLDVAESGNVPVYVVSIGEQNEIDSILMNSIATVSGGKYIHVSEIDTMSEKIREMIFKTEEISCQNFQFDLIPNSADITVDISSISVTSGNAETKIPPQFTYEVNPARSELLTVTTSQLGMNDEIKISFSATPKKDSVTNFGIIKMVADDPEKSVNLEKEIKILSKIELDINYDYPEMIYSKEGRNLEVILTNPSDKEISATVELQIIGDTATTTAPLSQKVGLDEYASKTVTWMLTSTEPEKGEAIFIIDITGNDIIETTTTQKSIPIDNVYHDAKWYKYGKVLFIIGILLTLVGAFSYSSAKKKAESVEIIIKNKMKNEFGDFSSSSLNDLKRIKKLANEFYNHNGTDVTLKEFMNISDELENEIKDLVDE